MTVFTGELDLVLALREKRLRWERVQVQTCLAKMLTWISVDMALKPQVL